MADILVIDDDANLRTALQMALMQKGHTCRLAENAERGWNLYREKAPDLALLDLRLPDMNGLELLARMRSHGVECPVVIMTGFGTVSNAVSAMKQGAAEFIEKPSSLRDVCELVKNLMDDRAFVRRPDAGSPSSGAASAEVLLLGECEAMREIRSLARKIASMPLDAGIGLVATLITGETGTGKEMLARLIHRHGEQPDAPFIHVNCTAIPESLFEAEHFGHERGVFTDAKQSRSGLIEAAEGGTLFLDEVGDMPLNFQSKLLLAVETGRFRRLGATSEKQVRTRIIAATNDDPHEKAAAGRFRRDLLHRLSMFHIRMPPLRERGEDIELLAEHFLERFARKLEQDRRELSPGAREAMHAYPWPGNVRELAHSLLRALVTTESGIISAEALQLGDGLTPDPADPPASEPGALQEIVPLAVMEERLIRAAMKHTGGNVAEAARLLGMPRGTLRYRIEKLGLESE